MNAQHNISGHAPGVRAIRFSTEWFTRPVFGILMAAIVVAVIVSGARNFAVLIALTFILAALEWHRCVGAGGEYRSEAAITAGTVAVALAVFLFTGHFWAGLLVAAAGTGATFVRAAQ